MIDVDAFEERAAIMEYDGGLTRFEAETLAAQAQGVTRWEALGEIGKRLVEAARNKREAAERNAEGDMPGVQPASEKENGPVPKRDV